MKLLVDMNLSPKWVGLFHDSGWEAVHWSAVGQPTARDSEIMTFAAANNFVVVTHDLDFSAILAVTHGKKPSVIQIRSEDVSAEFIGKQTVAALRHMLAELEAGALLTIEVGRTRLRLLPIQTEDEP
jgi:predicted nuclease of predicted toxin-antitoxin system